MVTKGMDLVIHLADIVAELIMFFQMRTQFTDLYFNQYEYTAGMDIIKLKSIFIEQLAIS